MHTKIIITAAFFTVLSLGYSQSAIAATTEVRVTGVFPYYALPEEVVHVYGTHFLTNNTVSDVSIVNLKGVCNTLEAGTCTDEDHTLEPERNDRAVTDGYFEFLSPWREDVLGNDVTPETFYRSWGIELETYLENGSAVTTISADDQTTNDNWFEVIASNADVPKTIPSQFNDQTYRYLINASRFRYQQERIGDLEQEYNDSVHFAEEIRRGLLGDLREDALWFNALFNAYEYGGYSIDDVITEIESGPCKVHVIIDKDAWSKTDTYLSC